MTATVLSATLLKAAVVNVVPPVHWVFRYSTREMAKRVPNMLAKMVRESKVSAQRNTTQSRGCCPESIKALVQFAPCLLVCGMVQPTRLNTNLRVLQAVPSSPHYF
eukprot:3945109-Amphidinium_carterae.1